MFRRSLCARFVQRGLCGIGAAAAASPAVGAAGHAALVGGPQQQALRFDFGATPRMHFALRHCASSSTPPDRGSGASSAPSSLHQQQRRNAADAAKTATSKSPPDADDVGRKAQAEGEALVRAFKACAEWWDTYVFGHDKDGVKPSKDGDRQSDSEADLIEFSFSSSIEALCRRLRVTDPAARAQVETDVYVGLVLHAREKLGELIAARKALATALENSPQDVNEKREEIVHWIRRRLACFEYKERSVFQNNFPDVPILVQNKAVAAALKDKDSALNKLLGTLSPPLDRISQVQADRDALRARLANAMVPFTAWWDSVVFGHCKKASSGVRAETIEFSFKDSIDELCKSLGVTDPAARPWLDVDVYGSFMVYARERPEELEKLVAARSALATALEDSPQHVARKRKAIIDWLSDMLVTFTYKNWPVFENNFAALPLLRDNKHVVSALENSWSALSKMLDALGPPLRCVDDLVRVLQQQPLDATGAAARRDHFWRGRIQREILFSDAGRASFTSRHVEPPVMVSHHLAYGGCKLPIYYDHFNFGEEFRLFTGESGSGRTIAAMQYALSQCACEKRNSGRKRVGIYMLGSDVFGPPGLYANQDQPSEPTKMTCHAVFVAVSRKVLEMVGGHLLLSSCWIDKAAAWCVRHERDSHWSVVLDPEFLAPSGDSCVTIVIDDVDGHRQGLRGLVEVATNLCSVLAKALNVGLVRIAAVGTSSDATDVYIEPRMKRFSEARCIGRREYWDAFEADRNWNLGLKKDARRLLENPRIAALFAEELGRTLAGRSERQDAEADAVSALAIQLLPVALRRFARIGKLGSLKSPVTAMLHALVYADSGAVVTIPVEHWQRPDLLADTQSVVAIERSEWIRCGELWGLLTDRATTQREPDPCIQARKSFVDVFKAVVADSDADNDTASRRRKLPRNGISRFRMPDAMLAATLFEISDRLPHGAGPSLEQDVFDALTLRALAPPLDARFCDFSCVTLLRHISSGLGNERIVGTNVHRVFVLRKCAFPIQYLRDVKQLAEKVKCVNRESCAATAPDQSSGMTVRDALGKEKAAIVVRNGPGAAFAHVLVLAPNKLVLVICDSFDSTTTTEHDVEEAFGKMGWPAWAGRRGRHRCIMQQRTTKALVELCRAGRKSYGSVTPVHFTVELVYVFSGGGLADEDAARPFVTHGPYPFPTKAVQEAGGAAAGHDKSGWAMRDPADSSVLYRRWIIHSGDDVRAAASREQYIAAREHYLRSTPDTAESKDRRDALFDCSKKLHALFPLIGAAPHKNDDNRKTEEAVKPLTTHADATTVDLQQQANNNEDWLAFSPIAGAPTLDVKPH